jgi:hypothetical protein
VYGKLLLAVQQEPYPQIRRKPRSAGAEFAGDFGTPGGGVWRRIFFALAPTLKWAAGVAVAMGDRRSPSQSNRDAGADPPPLAAPTPSQAGCSAFGNIALYRDCTIRQHGRSAPLGNR